MQRARRSNGCCRSRAAPAARPLALAIKSAEEALDYVPDMSPLARRLARRCWPGPITLVVDNQHRDSLTTQLPQSVRQAVTPNGTIGLRVPANEMAQDVLRMLAGPIVLTSANRSGEADAVTAQEVVGALGSDVGPGSGRWPVPLRPAVVGRAREGQSLRSAA